jgi:hypothetical protein
VALALFHTRFQQHQDFPGVSEELEPLPVYVAEGYRGSEKLKGKVIF